MEEPSWDEKAVTTEGTQTCLRVVEKGIRAKQSMKDGFKIGVLAQVLFLSVRSTQVVSRSVSPLM